MIDVIVATDDENRALSMEDKLRRGADWEIGGISLMFKPIIDNFFDFTLKQIEFKKIN